MYRQHYTNLLYFRWIKTIVNIKHSSVKKWGTFLFFIKNLKLFYMCTISPVQENFKSVFLALLCLFFKILSHCTFAKGTVMLVQWILTKVCLCNRKAIKQWDGVIYHQSNVLFEEDRFIDNDWWTYLLLHKCILRIITSSILLSYFNSGYSINISNEEYLKHCILYVCLNL